MSFSPIIRVRKLLDKMKSERDSPRLKRFPSRSSSGDLERSKLESSLGDYPIPFAMAPRTSSSSKLRDIQVPAENSFNYLPPETILSIFSFLEADDLFYTRLVSKEWSVYADDEKIWKDLVENNFNVYRLLSSSWKETYYKLERLFADGIWEGMSKWVEPAGYDNEQKTTCKLHFMKKNQFNEVLLKSPQLSKRVTRGNTLETTEGAEQPKVEEKIPLFKIMGTGITINCQTPSPFKIEGERIATDATGITFEWKKQFEQHTSTYSGKIDFETGSVEGTINYNDGSTQWKGMFSYTRRKGNLKPFQINA